MSFPRNSPVLPDTMRAVLDMRSKEGLVCRPEVEDRLKKIPFFSKTAAVAAVSAPHNQSGRFLNIGKTASPDGWRNYKSTFSAKQKTYPPAEDGFEVWTGKKKYGGGSSTGAGAGSGTGYTSYSSHTNSHSSTHSASNTTHTATSSSSPSISAPKTTPSDPGAWKAAKFQSLESKIATESVEDRILGKIRSKVNSLGESTYESTKSFMEQILDSDQTEFLGEFMQLVFTKAATEPLFCARYARLLHELGSNFSHLRKEMQSRFRDYTAIFEEAEKTPDVGAKDYLKFVEMQEQKKFRRGYSQFVAELAKHGEINMVDFRTLIETIVRFIESVVTIPEKTLLCEEYVDCLSRICIAGAPLLKKEEWIQTCLATLQTVSSLPRSTSPGLSNKARFAIMDLNDFAARGWKAKSV